MTAFPLGKLPATPARPKLRAARLLAGLPAPAAAVDMYSGVSSWPMYLNDRWGDCVWAGFGHHIQQITAYGQGAEVRVTDQDVEIGYESTGFRPDDPSTDRGTNVEDGLSYWRKAGVGGHAITAYAAVDVSSATQVKQAIQYFGGLGIGFNFPTYAMAQFNAGQAWDVQSHNAAIRGGHYVLAVGYDATYLYVVTWGKLQRMTWAFFRKYTDEAYVAIDDEMSSAVSRYISGTDLHAFGEEFADLTGAANPFPQPEPPAPDPAGPSGAMVAQAVREALTGLHV